MDGKSLASSVVGYGPHAATHAAHDLGQLA